MADASTIAIAAAAGSIGSFVVVAIREIISATRRQTKETEAAKVLVEGTKVLMAAEIAKLREEFRMEHDEELRRNGEVAASLRNHIERIEKEKGASINELGFWVRDNCVLAPRFSETVAGINRSIEVLGARMDAGLQRIEAKLEKIQLHG